jgi:hypothetical protein
VPKVPVNEVVPDAPPVAPVVPPVEPETPPVEPEAPPVDPEVPPVEPEVPPVEPEIPPVAEAPLPPVLPPGGVDEELHPRSAATTNREIDELRSKGGQSIIYMSLT